MSLFRDKYWHLGRWNGMMSGTLRGFPGGASGKEPAYQCRRHKRCGFNPWVGKVPWRRAWQSTLVFLPGEPMDRGAWRATVHRVTKSWTWLKGLSRQVGVSDHVEGVTQRAAWVRVNGGGTRGEHMGCVMLFCWLLCRPTFFIAWSPHPLSPLLEELQGEALFLSSWLRIHLPPAPEILTLQGVCFKSSQLCVVYLLGFG